MRNLLKILLAAVVFILLFALSALATDVYIDGVKVDFSDSTGYPFVQNGRTLVPLRATMESFGAKVEWDGNVNVI